MEVDKIIGDWKKKNFRPLYWLEGEESFYIDKLVNYAEHHILNENESAFNLTVFYGKDANWADVINACRRYPMFAERQVVLLKEAQQMRDVEKLEPYVENPLASTILIVSYKEKKVDGRTKFAKSLAKNGVVISTKKMYDDKLPEWTSELVQSKGLTISPKALMLLVDHIGNDLSRIDNEIGKLSINLGKRKNISEEDIEEYIGVSKEFNVFELQDALASKDLSKAIRIIQYFESNPKAAPIQLILPSLYAFFSKVFMIFGLNTSDEKAIATALNMRSSFFIKDYMKAAKLYSYAGVEKALLLFHHYNLRSIGIHDAGTPDAALLKEMVVKMMN
jgi:DNA polymerase-3 subunit delta